MIVVSKRVRDAVMQVAKDNPDATREQVEDMATMLVGRGAEGRAEVQRLLADMQANGMGW